MKKHMELVLLSFAFIFMASVLVIIMSGFGTAAYHISVFTVIISVVGGVIYYVLARSIVEYYGLCKVGKMLYKSKQLTLRSAKQLCRVSGGLQTVCNYLNKQESPERFIILDDNMQEAGTFENGKWTAKWKNNG